MDVIDKFYISLAKVFKIDKWYNVRDIPKEDIGKFVSMLYLCEKRKYIKLANKDVYAEMLGNPDWFNLQFKIMPKEYVSKYYRRKYGYTPTVLAPDYSDIQLKLNI